MDRQSFRVEHCDLNYEAANYSGGVRNNVDVAQTGNQSLIAGRFAVAAILCAGVLAAALPSPAVAQVTAFRQAVAERAARDDALAAFYRDRGFEGIWTGTSGRDRDRRNAFLGALADAGDHGLPMNDYDPDRVMARLRAAETPAEKGATEVYLSELFLQYARDIQTGLLTPGAVVPAIKREVPYRDRLALIRGFAQSGPAGFLSALPPQSPEYARLLREKLRLERLLARGGWGAPVPGGRLEAGDSGAAVVALRDRLVRMGYMDQVGNAGLRRRHPGRRPAVPTGAWAVARRHRR